MARRARNKGKEGWVSSKYIPLTPELNLKAQHGEGKNRAHFKRKLKAGDRATPPAWVGLGNLGLPPRGVKEGV